MYKLTLFLSLLIVLFYSCGKGADQRGGTQQRQITTSLEGNLRLLINNYTLGTLGITVECGGQKATLDHTGNFLLQNITVDERLATISIGGLPDYLPSGIIKTFVPNATHNFINIEIPNEPLLTAITLPGGPFLNTVNPFAYKGGGLNLKVEGNSYALAGTATPYNGLAYFRTVNYDASVRQQDPYQRMIFAWPLQGNVWTENEAGHLMGIQMSSDIFSILFRTKDTDKPLDLLPGKKASVEFSCNETDPFPADNPAYYLYRFDENTGLWKKVSQATARNEPYLGQPQHIFSAQSDNLTGVFVFARPYEVVKFSARLTGPNNSSVLSLVQVNTVGQRNRGFAGHTNNKGEITGYIPKNEQVELNVLQMDALGDYIYPFRDLVCRKGLGSFAASTEYGTIACNNMGDTLNRALITYSGQVVDCNGSPVAGALIYDGIGSHRYPIISADANGNFNFSITRSLANAAIYSIICEKPSGDKSCIVWPLSNTRSNNATRHDVGKIAICNINTEQYVKLTIDGLTTEYRPPAHIVSYNTTNVGVSDTFVTRELIYIDGSNFSLSYQGNYGSGSRPTGTPIMPGITITQWLVMPRTNITENKNSGSFYTAGSFQGMQVKYSNGTLHTISAEFRVKHNK